MFGENFTGHDPGKRGRLSGSVERILGFACLSGAIYARSCFEKRGDIERSGRLGLSGICNKINADVRKCLKFAVTTDIRDRYYKVISDIIRIHITEVPTDGLIFLQLSEEIRWKN